MKSAALTVLYLGLLTIQEPSNPPAPRGGTNGEIQQDSSSGEDQPQTPPHPQTHPPTDSELPGEPPNDNIGLEEKMDRDNTEQAPSTDHHGWMTMMQTITGITLVLFHVGVVQSHSRICEDQ